MKEKEKIIKAFKKLLQVISLIYFLSLPVIYSLALELNYPEFGGKKIDDSTSVNELIAWFYYAIVTLGGLAAFFMIVFAGFQYLTSAGNPSKMADARDKIVSALLGLLLIFASYIIVQTINPDLTILKLPALNKGG